MITCRLIKHFTVIYADANKQFLTLNLIFFLPRKNLPIWDPNLPTKNCRSPYLSPRKYHMYELHWMAAHACLKNKFMEDKKCHDLMTWLKHSCLYAIFKWTFLSLQIGQVHLSSKGCLVYLFFIIICGLSRIWCKQCRQWRFWWDAVLCSTWSGSINACQGPFYGILGVNIYWLFCSIYIYIYYWSMTKPTKGPMHSAKTQISLGIYPVWSVFVGHFTCSLGPKLSYAVSEDSHQIGRIPRLIWALTWRNSHFVSFLILHL